MVSALRSFFSFYSFFPFWYSSLVNVTAEEFQAKRNTLVPCFRNDADKSGNDGRVKKVLRMSFGITISFKNLKGKHDKNCQHLHHGH